MPMHNSERRTGFGGAPLSAQLKAMQESLYSASTMYRPMCREATSSLRRPPPEPRCSRPWSLPRDAPSPAVHPPEARQVASHGGTRNGSHVAYHIVQVVLQREPVCACHEPITCTLRSGSHAQVAACARVSLSRPAWHCGQTLGRRGPRQDRDTGMASCCLCTQAPRP